MRSKGRAAADQVLFEDNFDGSLKEAWDAIQGDWRIVEHRLSTVSRESEWSYILVGDPKWTDYAVEVDVDWTPNPVGDVLIFVRAQDSQSTMAFYGAQNANCEMRVAQDGEWNVLRSVGDLDDLKATLRVEVQGQLLRALVNGESILSINDPTYASGRVGLGIWCHRVNCITFDNFKVESLPKR